MPQGEGSAVPREQQRPPLRASASDVADLPPNHSLINSVADSARGRTLTYEDLARCFHLPINAAAKELGVCVTALKKQCRKHGVPRWPHRKLKSLDKLKEKLEKEEATAADKEYYKHELHSITQKKDHIFRSSSGNTPNAPGMNSTPPMSHLGASAQGSALHPRPGQLIMGRPVSHFHPGAPVSQKGTSPQIAAHYANAQTRSPAHVGGPQSGMDSEQQQQQHIIAGPLIMPFPQLSGAAPGMSGPSGAFMPQPAPGAQQYSMCGIYGCDCYMNNGVSSRMYHPPITAMRHPGAPSHATSNNMNGSAMPAGVHYFNPAAYAYAPSMAQMPPPYQNMVQFNVVEQSPFPNGARQPQPTTAPATNSMVNSSGSQSQQPMMQHPAKGTTGSHPPAGFEMYGNVTHAPNGSGGFVYNAFLPPQNVHYENMMGHQGKATTVPAYWSDVQHQQTPGNMVTMCNQTVHHHHHHGTETAVTSPSLMAQGNSARRQGFDNTSSKTNNSDVRALVNLGVAKDKQSKDALMSVDMEDGDNAQGGRARPEQHGSAEAKTSRKPVLRKGGDSEVPVRNTGFVSSSTPTTTDGKRDANINAEPQRTTQDSSANTKSCSSQSQSGSKRAGAVAFPNGGHMAPKSNVIRATTASEPSETSSYSGASNDAKQARNGEVRRPNKRARTQLNPEQKVASTNDKLEDGRVANRSVPKLYEAKGAQSEQQTTSSSRLSDHLESLREKNKHSKDPQKSRESPRKRILSNSGVPESGLPNGKPQSSPYNPTGWKESQGTGANTVTTTAGLLHRARRYDHVVHQCLGLQSAQWCTDMSFKVTLALGPKAMLGLAGVPSLGKSILDGTDTAIESRSVTKNRYAVVAKGQRVEWITTSGSNRYLIVMNPYRKRTQAEITGVSGIMIELKIIRALTK